MTETQACILITVFSLASLPVLVFCLTQGAEPKKLRRSLPLLGGTLLLRFGGTYVLSWLEMGWRLTPRYAMDFLVWALILVSIYQCMQAFALPQEKAPALPWMCSFLSMIAAGGLITLLMMGLYMDRLYESVTVLDGQAIIREGKTNGGVVRRFYLPVNFLVHGQELEYDWGTDTVTLPDGLTIPVH